MTGSSETMAGPAPPPPRREIAAVVLLGLLLYLPGLGPERGLWNPDEPRFGQIAREMVVQKEFATPLLNGAPYSNKPPLLFWSIIGASVITGQVDERAARLPSAVAAAALLGVHFAFAWRFGGRRIAWISTGVLGTSFRFMWQSGWVQTDMLLSLFVVLSISGYGRAARIGRVDPAAFIALYVGAALAVLSKGLTGIVLPGMVACADLARRRAWHEIPRFRIPEGIAVVALLVGPWLLAMHLLHGPGFLENLIIRQHFERYVDAFDHRSGPFFYFVNFTWQFLPWTLLIPGTILLLLQDHRLRREAAFPLVWFGTIFLFFTFSTSKRGQYLLPAFPAAAIVLGLVIDRFLRNRIAIPDARWIFATLRLAQWVTLLATLLAPLGIALCFTVLERLGRPVVVGGSTELLEMATTMAIVLAPMILIALTIGRRSRTGLVLGTAMIIAVVHLNLRVLVLPALDPHKSARGFAESVRAELPEETRLGAYRFWRGYLNFYLERDPVPVFRNPREGLDFLEATGPACVITQTRRIPELEALAGNRIERRQVRRVGNRELALVCARRGSFERPSSGPSSRGAPADGKRFSTPGAETATHTSPTGRMRASKAPEMGFSWPLDPESSTASPHGG